MNLSSNRSPFSLKQSALMQRVRQHGTTPELLVRRLILDEGKRYRLNYKKLPGSPDIVLVSLKKAIFVHGCFWHRHTGCYKATFPKSRVDFWTAKFEANIARDKVKENALLDLGWEVMTVWECETKNLEGLREKVRIFLNT